VGPIKRRKRNEKHSNRFHNGNLLQRCENLTTKTEVQISAYDTVQIKDEEVESYMRRIKESIGRGRSDIREAERALAMLGEKRVEFDKNAIDAIESFIAGTRDALYFKLEEEALKGSGKVTYENARKLIEEQIRP
jgi:hypothetical protein